MNNKIVEINSFNFSSTGNIMVGIARVAQASDYNIITYSPNGRSQKRGIEDHYYIGSIIERRLSDKINFYTGNQGSLNFFGTKAFLKELDRFQPDIIHLHNLHSNYINLRLLFNYINKHNISVIWTLHDCWSFTGHCPYFDIVGCNKWKTGCYDCEMYTEYPATKFDNSKEMYNRKKRLFTGVKDMTIVTPSQWLADLVQKSYLGKYPIKVIFNGIDLNKFKPRVSNFRNKYDLEEKFIILSVAFSWGFRKGQDRIEKLADILDARFQVVMVGITEDKVSSNNVICIPRTDNQEQLAEIYTAADVLLNPTREDNFPTVNIEALACGTPVLSYGAGGSAEAFDEKSGMIVNDDSILEVLDKLYLNNFSSEDCLKRGKQFDQKDKFQEYVKLYDSV